MQERLGVLQWVRVHHYPPNTCTLAAEGGHLGLLQWVRKHGCQWDKWNGVPLPLGAGTWRCWCGRESTGPRGAGHTTVRRARIAVHSPLRAGT